jgi:hypothetical protein
LYSNGVGLGDWVTVGSTVCVGIGVKVMDGEIITGIVGLLTCDPAARVAAALVASSSGASRVGIELGAGKPQAVNNHINPKYPMNATRREHLGIRASWNWSEKS